MCLCYGYLLVYIDNILSIGEYEYGTISMLEQCFSLKEGSLGIWDVYLGANVERDQTTYGQVIWSINFQDYIKSDIYKVKK